MNDAGVTILQLADESYQPGRPPSARCIGEACVEKYRNLTACVHNLVPYFDFVACTRRASGPIAGTWKTEKGGALWGFPASEGWDMKREGGGRPCGIGTESNDPFCFGQITIDERYHGFAIDRHAIMPNSHPGGSIPFFHGVKDMAEAVTKYGFEFRFRSHVSRAEGTPEECKACLDDPSYTVSVSDEKSVTVEEQAKRLAKYDYWSVGTERPKLMKDHPMDQAPRFLLKDCIMKEEVVAGRGQELFACKQPRKIDEGGANNGGKRLSFDDFKLIKNNIYEYTSQPAKTLQ